MDIENDKIQKEYNSNRKLKNLNKLKSIRMPKECILINIFDQIYFLSFIANICLLLSSMTINI